MNGKLLLTILAATVGLVAHAATEERGNLVLDNIPSVETPLTTRLEDYLNSRGASFVDWMPDGSLLISTRFAARNGCSLKPKAKSTSSACATATCASTCDAMR